MADPNSSKADGAVPAPLDALIASVFYRLRRDTMMLVCNLHRGGVKPNLETVRRQVVFVQGQLCEAIIADPAVPQEVKSALVGFQDKTIKANLAERRGARRRQSVVGQV